MGYPRLAESAPAPALSTRLDLTTVPTAAYACDAAGRITYYNLRAAELWGRHPIIEGDADRYSAAFELYSPDGAPLLPEDCAVAEVLRTRAAREGRPIVIGRPDGSRRVVLEHATPVRADDGSIVGATALLVDVTQQEQALEATRAALRASEANYRGFFDSRAVGAAQVNAEGRFMLINDRYCEITGYSREELLTMGPLDITHAEDLAEDLERVKRALEDPNGVYITEKRYLRKNGEPIWVQVAANFLRDASGRPVRTVAIVTDIDERKRAAAALQEADRRKDEFLAMLAHELRNPLAPLQHAAEILGHPDGGAVKWCRTVIDRQVRHLTRLIDDLLDLSRITRDKLELKKSPTDLTRILDSAIEASRPMLDLHEQVIRRTAPPGAIHLEGDPIRLTQVFTNLLTNAAKFNDRPGTIDLHAALEGATVVVTVADQGIGIASDDLPRLFDKFYQSARNGGGLGCGLGIGLSLVRRLVELHGGTVEARSVGPGHGSEFIVRLPGIVAAEDSAGDPAAPPHAQRVGAGKRILVVDDNCDAADSLGQLLELMGHAIATEYDGAAAIERAQGFAADIVLLDLGMPGIDGFEVCRRLRRLELTAPPRIVAMTGWGRPEDRARTRDAGFDAHLVKPVDRAALASLLDEPVLPR